MSPNPKPPIKHDCSFDYHVWVVEYLCEPLQTNAPPITPEPNGTIILTKAPTIEEVHDQLQRLLRVNQTAITKITSAKWLGMGTRMELKEMSGLLSADPSWLGGPSG